MRVLVLSLCVLVSPLLSLSPTSYLAAHDKARLAALFSSSLAGGDTATTHYSVLGLLALQEKVADTKGLCSAAAAVANDNNVETLYHAAEAAKALGCPITLGKEATAAVAAALEGTSSASIFFAAKAQVATGAKLNSDAIKKSLAAALKKDDTLLSLGLAFHTASMLDGDLSQFFERIEDAVVQADEVNGEMLQFEGGLSVTSVLITGAANLAIKAKKTMPLTGDQTIKFANYLMSRKSVQQPKGGYHLIEAVQVLASNPQYVPVVVALASPVAVSADNPNIVVSLTDLAGNSPGDFKLMLETATRVEDGAVVAAKQSMTHMKTTTKYTTDLMTSNPPAGFYELVLTASPVKADPRIVGNTGVTLTVKVLTSVSVANAEVKITDTEQGTAGKATEVQYPGKLGQKLKLDYKEKLSMKFAVLDDSAKKPKLVHQAFVKLTHIQSGAEIIYVAEPNTNKQYNFELDMNTAAGDFGSKSGLYSLSVIIGDAVIANPLSWLAAELDITLPAGSGEAEAEAGPYQARPEIRHVFRQPETRPAALVSNVFSLLCLAPVLIMLAMWAHIGVNVSNFPLSVPAIGFHVGLAAIFVLYFYFWVELNMFATVKYLAGLGVVTFLCGNKLLANIAAGNKAA